MSFMRFIPKTMMAAALSAVMRVSPAQAEDADPKVILITNVNVFDGVNEKQIKNANVVVTDNMITAVSSELLAVAGGKVIDGDGGRSFQG